MSSWSAWSARTLKKSIPLAELMQSAGQSEASALIRQRVVRAREIQSKRYVGLKGIHCKSHMPEQDMESYCGLELHAKRFLLKQIDRLQYSARSYTRILKVSRTIADLVGSGEIELAHVAEAVHFRSWDRPVKTERK